ncbi:RNA polymerase factor sigma-54 [Paenibacillus sp. YIM B09110]|uniref:RNA polymerase factor sigma-54 n=1 Tax=Paenibacillus sp. YIM B09110 TaxID=3126102 RepID=UPI00301E5E7E
MTPPSSAMNMLLLPQMRCSLAPELRQSLMLLQMTTADLFSYLQEFELDNPLIQLEWITQGGNRKRDAGWLAESAGLAGHRTEQESLEQALLAQIRLSDAPGEAKRAAAFLAGSLNESGYLEIGLDDAAACTGLATSVVEAGLRLLHALEPAGVAAASMKECLMLQASRDSFAPKFVIELIQWHLGDVAKGRWKAIGKALGAGELEIERAVRYLRGLHPRPGLPYGESGVSYAIPEIKLRRIEGGAGFAVRVASPFQISFHASVLDTGAESRQWRDWVAAKRKEAAQLEGMLRFRKSALASVTAAIAAHQQRFLDEGDSAIRPLKLEQIAADTGYHLSTVSRAVRGKYVDTPFGVLPMHRFFSASLGGDGGEAVSSRAVKHRIRALIAGENKQRPFTDADLAARLREEGVTVSRRTVAKYREEERIMPSAFRALTL